MRYGDMKIKYIVIVRDGRIVNEMPVGTYAYSK